MSKEVVIVLLLTAITVVGVVWLEIKPRRNSRSGQ
jgi:hypothetical protein